MSEVQRHNREKMTVLSSLVKAVLLHERNSADPNSVQDEGRRDLLTRVHSDAQYQEWLADKFFVFYLNRTRSYQGGQGKPDIAKVEERVLEI